MKIYAGYMRGMKDLEDLSLLKPNSVEISGGIKYIQEVILKNHGQVELDKAQGDLEEFKKVLSEQ